MKLHGSKYQVLYDGIIIEVTGFPHLHVIGCSEQEAEQIYRRRFGLGDRRIRWN